MEMKLAGCIIRDKDNRILLLHRNMPERQQWEIPGGKIQDQEQPEEAAIREAKEELDIDVSIVKKLGEKAFTQDKRSMYYTWYLAHITLGEVRIAEPEMFDDARYFSLAEMRQRFTDLSPNAQNFLLAFEARQVSLG